MKKFIPSKYEKGISLREDLYQKQFSITVFGYYHYYCDETREDNSYKKHFDIKRKFSSISKVSEFILKMLNCHWNNTERFICTRVSINDRQNRHVITGAVISKQVYWYQPVSMYDELRLARIERLKEQYEKQAQYEMLADNYFTARNLRESAEKLSFHITHPAYIKCDEMSFLMKNSSLIIKLN